MSIDRDFVLHTLQSLIRIDSRNPGLEDGAPGEMALARHVHDLLRRWGWQAELHDLGEGRANVVARRTGSAPGPSLMLNAHLDTVGIEGMTDPFSASLRGGRVYGRGAQDTKGGLAAVLALARDIGTGTADLPGALLLAFVADEEYESRGTTALLRESRTDSAIVLEPSDLDVVVGHRGFGIFDLQTRGRTAHGGRPDLGVDANRHMGLVLSELDRLAQAWQEDWHHPDLGAASLHVPLISGGRHLFVYSDHCTAKVECRTVPGQTANQTGTELRAAMARAGSRHPGFAGEVELEMWRPPYAIDPDRPVVRAACAGVAETLGRDPQLRWHSWWEDSGLLGEAGIDSVVLGPTGGGLHTEEEWVDLDSVVDLAEILKRAIRHYLGGAGNGKRHD